MANKEGLGLEITELRLGLPCGAGEITKKVEKKRVFSSIDSEGESGRRVVGEAAPKSQVVGWPPVCSYRRKNSFNNNNSKAYVKVSMDGAPFLRKIDLSMHNAYPDLSIALDHLFGSFASGEGLNKDGDSCEFAPIYEDKDGDWMLVGDVPWEMFVESCKRLRIMKKSDALGIGLEPKNFLLKANSLKCEA